MAVKTLGDFDDVVEDVPVILQSTTFSDDYEGGLENRRTIIYTMVFDMKVAFWGPKRESNIINRIDVDFFSMDPQYYLETLRVETDPIPVSEDSDYNVLVDIFNRADPNFSLDVVDPEEHVPAQREDDGSVTGSYEVDLSKYDAFDPARAQYSIVDSANFPGDIILNTNGQLELTINDYPVDIKVEYKIENTFGESIYNNVHIIADPTNFDAIVTQGGFHLGTQDSDQDVVLITE